jgi:O-succinylbenzoic acid--CoA ligase
LKNVNPILANSPVGLDWLGAQALANPQALALEWNNQRYSYQQLDRAVSHRAAQLIVLGIEPGERVALWLPTSFALVELILAVMRLGALAVPLNRRLSGPEIEYQVAQVACRYLIHDETLHTTQTQVEQIALEALPIAPAYAPVSRKPLLDNPCLIIHTSGTSGRPKGAVLTYGNLFYSALASAAKIGTLPYDRWLCLLPLYHIGGISILMRAILYGASVVLQEKFDPQQVNHTLTTQPISLVSLVPTMLYRLLQLPPQPWQTRLILLGGAAASQELISEALACGLPIATTYGLTEAASQVATALPGEVRAKPGTVGRPLLFTQLSIQDEQGHLAPPGQYGEIVLRSPSVMWGYWGGEKRLNQLATGDLGYVDEDGDLWLVQRRSDLIISGGENIYPSEVEAVLGAHPAIADSCVVGLPHPEWGQQVAAAIILKAEQHSDPNEIIAFCRQRLAGYKIPRSIIFVDDFPRTASGKIIRAQVVRLLGG